MDPAEQMRFLARLVHKGLVSADSAKQALARGGDPLDALTALGVPRAELDRWLRTDAGDRPELKRYELLALLGEGGTARVWRAKDRTTGAEVALKVLRADLARDPVALAKFVKESQLLIELDSPRIVKGLRVAREGDVYFCAMEVVEGECLQEVLERDGRLDEETALRVVAQIAEALAELHEKGLVHRDVKPGNILWTEDGRAVLIDLGFAVRQGEAAGDTTAGTVHYIAPEQARAESGLDERADIYALGASLYHLVTGSLPFEGSSNEEVMRKQVLESLSGERIRALGLAPQVHWLIEKMMAKEKEIRFQSHAQVVEEITAYLTRKEQERASQQEEPEQTGRKKRRIRFR
jgi:serine/threonine-protein kinase